MLNDNNNGSPRNIPINQWAKEDRPREKMLSLGKKSLTDSELIAILLRTGIQGASAIELAKHLLQSTRGSLNELARMEVSDLCSSHKGLGMAKAVTVLAALELGNRMLKEERNTREDIITNSHDLFCFIAPSIVDLPHEEFWAVYLNQRNKVIWKQRIASGGITSTIVDPRVIFRIALEHNAVAFAVAHNHPSGNLDPSRQDKQLTHQLQEGGRLLEIKLLEHIIVGVNPDGQMDYFSFHDNSLI